MNLASALSELGERLGIGSIELDQDGGCLLVFDDELMVDIENADDGVSSHISATVFSLPAIGREQIFAELLEANLQGRGTGLACLAYDSNLDEIVLSQSFANTNINVDDLERHLEAFLTVLEVWRQRYQAGKVGSIRTPAATNSLASTNQTQAQPIRC